MSKDERIYYFIGQDNIGVLKGLHNQNTFKGNYKFKYFGERTINFDSNLLSNEKSLLSDNERTVLKGHIVYFDILRNQPYTENLSVSLYTQVNLLSNEIKRLQKENSFLQQKLFNIKGSDKFNEEMLDFLDLAGKAKSKIYQFSQWGGEGGYLDSGLLGRYSRPLGSPMSEQGE